MPGSIEERIGAAVGARVVGARPLSGGCVGDVRLVSIEDGTRVVAKIGRGDDAGLDTEGWMLRYLSERTSLPVPRVLHTSHELLVMEHLPGRASFDESAERHAAELLAALHGVRGETFGLERDTLIGGLPQPNPPSEVWVPFFAKHRLVEMGAQAAKAGRLPARTLERVRRLAERLDRWLEEPAAPGLIHGDVWSGNVLAENGRVTGFLDPAIYYADPEIELAFITLFGTFGGAFFERYHELRPIREGFFETRRDLYNLYPLLVHVRLFGGGYLTQVERTLERFE